MAPSRSFPVTGDDEANRLLVSDPFALLLGMLLDQQVPMEWAFASPAKLRDRLSGELDPATLAAMAPEQVEELFKQKPALHRFPGSMAKRAHALCQVLVDDYGGDAERVWSGAGTGEELFGRLRALPGFGDEKARIFVAVLAKRMDVAPPGWQEAAGPFADGEPRSVADIDSRESFAKVREWKKIQKQKGKSKAD